MKAFAFCLMSIVLAATPALSQERDFWKKYNELLKTANSMDNKEERRELLLALKKVLEDMRNKAREINVYLLNKDEQPFETAIGSRTSRAVFAVPSDEDIENLMKKSEIVLNHEKKVNNCEIFNITANGLLSEIQNLKRLRNYYKTFFFQEEIVMMISLAKSNDLNGLQYFFTAFLPMHPAWNDIEKIVLINQEPENKTLTKSESKNPDNKDDNLDFGKLF